MSLEKILSQAVLATHALADRVTSKTANILDQSMVASQFLADRVPKNGELTVFGQYSWPDGTTDQDEIKYLLAGQWSPSTQDFMAVTGISARFSFKNFEAILSEIAQHRQGSIKRVNLWAHANSAYLGISGTVVPDNVYFESMIDGTSVNNLNSPGLEISENSREKVRRFGLADIRKSFAANAVLVLYACNAAVDQSIMQALANLLHVHVVGFESSILYCPPRQENPPFKRSGTKIGLALVPGGCEKNATVDDWRILSQHRSAVISNPQ